MAKAKIFKIQGGGKTYFIPSNGVKTLSEAAKSVGFAPEQYFGLTVYSKEGETAEEFVARKGGTITEAKIDVDYTRASIVDELPPPTGEERFGVPDAQINSYNQYLEYIKKPENNWLPAPKDLADFVANKNDWWTWAEQGYSPDLAREFQAWGRYASKYAELDDWRPVDIKDWWQNYDKAQELLTGWQGQATEEEVEYTDEQVREFNTFKAYASKHGEITDWFPVSIEDYFNNYEQSQQQFATWEQRAAEVGQYEISDEEALRRKEEAYEEGRYAAQERYGETPQYQPPFTQWLGEQGQFSGALEQFVESQYPSLRSEFQATQPRLTGFPTREEARAEATRREQAWQGWLPGQTPGLQQEYWAQRPAERGERLWMQAPGLRTANW